jgi:AAA15 family ATPase/GTPase
LRIFFIDKCEDCCNSSYYINYNQKNNKYKKSAKKEYNKDDSNRKPISEDITDNRRSIQENPINNEFNNKRLHPIEVLEVLPPIVQGVNSKAKF